MKNYITALLISIAPAAALAVPGENIGDQYFSASEPKLTPQERAGIAISKKWEGYNSADLKPVQGIDGSVKFLFGASRPSIVCAVLQVCDIELQSGELVNSIHLGDSARWTVEPAISGTGDTQVQHLLVKPMDVGLDTSLVVTTNRRTYHLRLRSTRNNPMTLVSFTYPEDATKKWDLIQTKSSEERVRNTIPETGDNIKNLNFNYDIDGDAVWKPVRVYNDGRKTVIEMPQKMAQTEAPTLLVVNRGGGIFSEDEQTMVNYRVQDNRFIVDSVFDQAILIIGVGGDQNRVTITKGE